MSSLLQILFTVFENVFGFWPFFMITPLLSRKNRIRNTIYVWSFWVIIRILLFFNPEPITKPLTLIPEPLSTMLFFGIGFILIVIWIGMTFRRQSRA
jgi:hypothetical protein